MSREYLTCDKLSVDYVDTNPEINTTLPLRQAGQIWVSVTDGSSWISCGHYGGKEGGPAHRHQQHSHSGKETLIFIWRPGC